MTYKVIAKDVSNKERCMLITSDYDMLQEYLYAAEGFIKDVCIIEE